MLVAYMLRGSAAQRAAVPGVPCAALQLLAMHVAGDFFLYWGHRCQHEGLGVLVGLPPAKSPWLWVSVHALHHTVRAPTPFATLYLHPLDTLLQVSLGVRLDWDALGCALGCGFAALRTGWITVRGLWLTTFLAGRNSLPLRVRPRAATRARLCCGRGVAHFRKCATSFRAPSGRLAEPGFLRRIAVRRGGAGAARRQRQRRQRGGCVPRIPPQVLQPRRQGLQLWRGVQVLGLDVRHARRDRRAMTGLINGSLSYNCVSLIATS